MRAFETDLGWVICGNTGSTSPSAQANVHITTFHTSVMSSDDVLRKFWELEESPSVQACLSAEERIVVRHFESNHTRSTEGRFSVPLPRNPSATPLGESRSQAVRRFLSLGLALSYCFCSLRSILFRSCIDRSDSSWITIWKHHLYFAIIREVRVL